MKTDKLRQMKGKEKIVMVTAYDALMAKLVEPEADIVLVGDSVANVLLGYKDTKSITMAEMLHHCRAVVRAGTEKLVVGDMPINSYNTPEEAVENAKKFIDAGCDAVKFEGAKIEEAKALRKEKIELMGHLGLLPQSAEEYRVQGKENKDAEQLIKDAVALDEAGCFAIVLECVLAELAEKITEKVKCPTIGIGAGPKTDGQVLVINDLLGFTATDSKAKFVKGYANIGETIKKAVKEFREDVKEERYPDEEFCYC